MLKRLPCSYINIADIHIGSRLRKDTPDVRAKIESIARSIQQFGPLVPINLDSTNQLVEGWCRIQAFKLLNESEIPFLNIGDVTAEQRLILEIEANAERSDLTWQEKCIGIAQVHNLKSGLHRDWELRATGSLVRMSHAYVKDAVYIADYLLRGDEEISNAETLSKAMDICLRRKEEAVIAHNAAIAGTAHAMSLAPVKPQGGILTLTLGPPGSPPPSTTALPSPVTTRDVKTISLTQQLHNVDCLEFMRSMPESCVDGICTDIPYGIDMKNLEGMHGIEDMLSTHEVDQNVSMMQPFLEGSFRVLKPNTYLCFFYAQQHQEKLATWGREAGFSVLDWNLLWLKPHSCHNNAPQCNPTKSYEPVMIMKKGSPLLRAPMTKCHMEVDGIPEKKNQSNPFAKPLQFLLEMILKPMAIPGSTWFDPFAGEGSIARAMILHGVKPLCCEISTERFPRLVERVKGVYKNALGPNTQFT